MTIAMESNISARVDGRGKAAASPGPHRQMVHHRRRAAGAAGRRVRRLQCIPHQNDHAVLRHQQAAAGHGNGCGSKIRSGSQPADGGRRSRRRASGQCHLGCERTHHRDPVHGRLQRQSWKPAHPTVRCPRTGRPRKLQGAGHGGAAVARPRQAAGVASVRAAGHRRFHASRVRPGQRRHRQDPGDHLAETGAGAVRRRTRRAQGRGRPVPDRGHADRDVDRPVDALSQLHRNGEG